MNHVDLTALTAELRRHGRDVVVLNGAQGRSARRFTNGYTRGCQASVLHHTASSGANPAAEIDYILRGKGDGYVIANAYLSRAGTITLIASGPTYTEGSGGPYGIIPKNGANDVCFSIEIANRGDGRQAYTRAQADSVAVWNAVVPALLAGQFDWPDDPWAAHRLFTHFEWTSRKIDCLGPVDSRPQWSEGGKWNMGTVRADGHTMWQILNPSPTGDSEMQISIWRDGRYKNQFAVGASPIPTRIAGATMLTPNTKALFVQAGVSPTPYVTNDNATRDAVLTAAGVPLSELDPV